MKNVSRETRFATGVLVFAGLLAGCFGHQAAGPTAAPGVGATSDLPQDAVPFEGRITDGAAPTVAEPAANSSDKLPAPRCKTDDEWIVAEAWPGETPPVVLAHVRRPGGDDLAPMPTVAVWADGRVLMDQGPQAVPRLVERKMDPDQVKRLVAGVEASLRPYPRVPVDGARDLHLAVVVRKDDRWLVTQWIGSETQADLTREAMQVVIGAIQHVAAAAPVRGPGEPRAMREREPSVWSPDATLFDGAHSLAEMQRCLDEPIMWAARDDVMNACEAPAGSTKPGPTDPDLEAIAALELRRAFTAKRSNVSAESFDNRQVIVLAEASADRAISARALPADLGVTFHVMSRAAMQAQVDRTRLNVRYIELRIHVDGDTARVDLAVRLGMPVCTTAVAMCCCTHFDEKYVRRAGGWVHVPTPPEAQIPDRCS